MKTGITPHLQKEHVLLLTLLLLTIIPVSAKITGSIGNARMVLYAQEGDSINKCVLVKNVNDIPVKIQIFAAGDLADDITLKEKGFTLAPHEDKDACFTILVSKEGTTESKINVMFSPEEEGNGVGLSSTIIVIAQNKEGFLKSIFGSSTTSQNNSSGGTPRSSGSLFLIVCILAAILLAVLLVLLYYSSQKKKDRVVVPINSLPPSLEKPDSTVKKGGKIKK